jgi:hypothetical protein
MFGGTAVFMEFSWNPGILSRISGGFESRPNHAVARNPGVGMSGQVLFHPSHICQIGESDQGRFLQFRKVTVSARG